MNCISAARESSPAPHDDELHLAEARVEVEECNSVNYTFPVPVR